MTRAIELLTLIGFLLMTSEFIVHDRKRLDTYWNNLLTRIVTKPFLNITLTEPFHSLTRKKGWKPVTVASAIFWGGVIISYVLATRSGYYDSLTKAWGALTWDLAQILDTLMLTIIFIIVTGLPLLCLSLAGLVMLVLYFTERSLRSGSAIYFGLQLGAYFTICAQVVKVIFPN